MRVSTRTRWPENARNSGTTIRPEAIVPRLCGSSAQATTSTPAGSASTRTHAFARGSAAIASNGQNAIAPSAAEPLAYPIGPR